MFCEKDDIDVRAPDRGLLERLKSRNSPHLRGSPYKHGHAVTQSLLELTLDPFLEHS